MYQISDSDAAECHCGPRQQKQQHVNEDEMSGRRDQLLDGPIPKWSRNELDERDKGEKN